MAKKGVVIFDGEDMFINPKKAIYSKTRGESRNTNSFVSARGDEEGAPDGPRILRDEISDGGGSVASLPTISTPISEPIINQPVENVNESSAERRIVTPVEREAPITISVPRAEIPTIVVPPILPPTYIAPSPVLPTTKTPPERPERPGFVLEDDFIAKRPGDDGSAGRYSGPDNNPGNNTTPIYVIDDGTPVKPILDDKRRPIGEPIATPVYTAPVPQLPSPPAAIIIADPLGGGGSPLLGDEKEVPKVTCPKGFVLNAAGICTPIVEDPCAGFPKPQLAQPPAGFKWVRQKDCKYKLEDDGTGEGVKEDDKTTSNTTTTTTKLVDKISTPATSSTTTTTTKKVEDTTTSSTTTTTTKSTSTTDTTTTKAPVKCNPPIYAAPKYFKWVDKGDCRFDLVVDETQLKDAAPTPVLPATGQPIININIPSGLGTVPTTSTTVQTSTKALPSQVGDSGSGGGGGGGGTPFPEEPAPIVEAPAKKNYFWWYVIGGVSLFLLIKRKKK
jgi:hypothetical protein